MPLDRTDGSLLALGLVGALAAASVVKGRGSRSGWDDYYPDEDVGDQQSASQQQHDYPDEWTLADSLLITEAAWGDTTLSLEGSLLSSHRDREGALKAAREWLKTSDYYPDIYVLNERGNIDLVDAQGNVLASWV